MESMMDFRTKKAIEKHGSLAEKYPQIVQEWDYTINLQNPENTSCGTDYMAWWVCSKCNNKYQMRVSHRTKGHGCPYCSGHKIAKGYNDLKTYCINNNLIYIINEWDYKKNDLKPDDFTPQSNKKVYWLCPIGHSYSMSICHRTSRLGQCPICNKESKTSFPEQALLFYLSNEYDEVINRDTKAIGFELDIYIPSIKTAIEYDGFDMHKNRYEQDYKKNIYCKNNSINLIRIREGELPIFDNCICLKRINFTKLDSLNAVIEEVLNILGVNDKIIDVNKDASVIYSKYMSVLKDDNFAILFPELVEEWNYKMNNNLQPNMFSKSSNKRVWWICSKGHQWQATINKRTAGRGCPICSNKKILTGQNDIVTFCKQNKKTSILNDWDKEKNSKLGFDINKMFPGSTERVWWKCQSCGNEWMSSINNRIKKGHMCPQCRKQKGIGQNRKKIINCETGKIYNSMAEAAREINISATCISSCCSGKAKTAGGFHWKYFDF